MRTLFELFIDIKRQDACLPRTPLVGLRVRTDMLSLVTAGWVATFSGGDVEGITACPPLNKVTDKSRTRTRRQPDSSQDFFIRERKKARNWSEG